MDLDTIREHAPSAKKIGRARLSDYRLRFSRRSIRTGTGVADIVQALGFTVVGVLFEIDETDWGVIQKKEGLHLEKPAYREIVVKTYSYDEKKNRQAVAFQVVEPETLEQVPSASYIGNIRDRVHELDEPNYAEFIDWLYDRSLNISEPPLRDELLVAPTRRRWRTRGRYIIRMNTDTASNFKAKREAAIEFQDKIAVADVQIDNAVPLGQCEIDQNLRHTLGIHGLDTYGHVVKLNPLESSQRLFRILQPRTLSLSVYRTNWSDSEKRICILHPKNLSLLGLKEGEHVTMEYAHRDDDNLVRISMIRIRAFTSEKRKDQERDYPAVDKVYLDRECRDELGMSSDITRYMGYPVIVRPSIRHLFRRRLAIYGVTFFLGISSLGTVASMFMPNIASPVRGVIAVGVAVIATLVVVLADLRSSVKY